MTDDHLGGADRAGTGSVGQPGGQLIDDGLQLGAVGLELAPGFADRDRQPAQLTVIATPYLLAVDSLSDGGSGVADQSGDRLDRNPLGGEQGHEAVPQFARTALHESLNPPR